MTTNRTLQPYQQDAVADMFTEWCEHHIGGLEDWQRRALDGVLRGDMPTVPPIQRRSYANRAQYDGLVSLYYLNQQPGDPDD